MIKASSVKPNIIADTKQTLPRRLLLSVLPLVLVPLLVAGGLGYTISRNRGREAELKRVRKDGIDISLATESIFKGKQDIIEVVRQSPEILALFAKSKETVASQGLNKLNLSKPENLEALEKRFDGLHQLETNPEINTYLKRLLRTDGLAEIFITDRNGFTLAAGEPTSDFVQSDEKWWQAANSNGSFIDEPEFDESAQQSVVATARKIYDPAGLESLGVVKMAIKTDFFQKELARFVQKEMVDGEQIQLIDSKSGNVVTTITKEKLKTETKAKQQLLGGKKIQQISQQVVKANLGGFDYDGLEAFKQNLSRIGGFELVGDLDITALGGSGQAEAQVKQVKNRQDKGHRDTKYRINGVLIKLGDRYYSLTAVRGTDLVAVSSEEARIVNAAGQESLNVFIGSSLILSILGSFFVLLLARNLAQPLVELTKTAEEVAEGKLDLRVDGQGTVETRTLATAFNRLLDEVQGLLGKQEKLAAEQGRQRDELEGDIMQLMDDVSDASEGDLTVRAQLSATDVGIVADLFNSIIENLRNTAMQVKTSSGQVGMSLDVNAEGIRSLATQAIAEANSLRQTMQSVEEVSMSIQTVANNADQASKLTDETYASVQDGSEYMDKTVDSILNLRSTVGETAKKIKRLGESAQKISQTVSLIDEIALKTNLLAVNASVEAARAGELGQGFTAVAEQVGALAEQSASATKEIAQIVSAIQAETQEVVGAIETGTAQVVDSTQLVESTKQRLTQVLQKSAQINQLMRSISESTTAQTAAADVVTNQVKSATVESEQRAKASEQMAQAIQDTAEIARSLQESVAQFKVADTADLADAAPSIDVQAAAVEEGTQAAV
ncbi:HAMP domain-containing protein [filamentous cyanobacterium LEGE 11480]|uniref:HAMP domain-containing protein n=1 Tax=Romeriopsis navalis LEGE 11480 TaxID=2777977 RepID=A0A928VN97_9CYAN|nr:methyl-accepting chemotaxis protein [Romeriopsis navalis]MBE9029099.1 HAMP domain-containing protein [Romeriopsis navalis LEGE 11480]